MREISKVLVIGLDGATFELLRPLLARGLMPFLQSLLETSYSGVLLSTVPPISATAWATFVTGANPGKHGVLQFVKLRPGQDDLPLAIEHEVFPGGVSLLNADSVRGLRLWDILSSAGKRQVVINVPLTYPPRPLNGVMITGMMTPPTASIFTYPPGLSRTLLDAEYETDLHVSEKEFDFDPGRLMDRLHELLIKRRDVALHLMAHEPWDFFMVVFTGTDRLQHRFWKFLVPGFPEYDSAEAIRVRPQLERYFAVLDEVVADLVSSAESDTLTVILSDHGFGPVSERTVHRLSMMRALGLAEASAESGIGRLRTAIESHLGLTPDQVRKVARKLLPRRWLAKVEARATEALLTASAKDPAYSVTLHEYVGGIYVNSSHFADARSLEVFRDGVISRLKKLVDAETATPIIAEVYTREELYSGPALTECPDIVFYVTPGYGLSGGAGPRGQIASARKSEPNKQGTHRDEGILIVHGNHVKVRQGVRERLIDVTATILYWMGAAIPTDMDSRPILAAFDDRLVAERPACYTDIAPCTSVRVPGQGESALGQEDAEELLLRLRGLGYIE